MACSYDNTRNLAKKKGIINNFDELLNNTGKGVDNFYEFARSIKNLATSKFGELPEGITHVMRLDGKKVIFNKGFFNWVDKKNAEKTNKQFQKSTEGDNTTKYQLAQSELLELKPISEQFDRDVSELNQYNIRDLQREDKERKGEKLSEKDEEYFKNSRFSKNQVLNLGNPSSILQKIGMPDLPITTTSNWLLEHIIRNPEHNLRLLNLKGLVEAIHNPIAIFQDKDYKGQDGRIEILTTIKSRNGKPSNVIIQFNRQAGKLNVNAIVTAFETDLFRFQKATKQNSVKYIDKERITDYLQGVLLPTLLKNNAQKGILVYPKSISDSSTNIEKFLYYVNNFPDILTKDNKKYQQAIATGDETLLESTDNQSLTTGLEWLKQVLPNSNVQLVDGLIDKIGRGAYKEVEDLIVASKQYADKGTIKHEAIHRVLALLPENEREAILNEASKLFNIPRGKSTVKTKYSQAQQNEINYAFRAIENIQKNINKVVNWYGNKNVDFLKKLNEDLQIPKDQIELLKQTYNNLLNKARVGIPSNKEFIEEMLADFAANYSYTVEINVAKGGNKDLTIQQTEFRGEKRWSIVDSYTTMPLKSFKTEKEANDYLINELQKPTSHYSNLTVPGGTNYTENEIATPAITPSIKGHAQFATDKGIGWFRSDEKEMSFQSSFVNPDGSVENIFDQTKTRRILEVQSDLFQKGRDKDDLVIKKNFEGEIKTNSFIFKGDFYESKSGFYYKNNEKINAFDFKEIRQKYLSNKESPESNQFLQLLNKDNNWVTFFVKSIIQDSAKKGYEKVLFPTGNTASKVEGHTTLEEFKKQKEDRIKELEKEIPKDTDDVYNTHNEFLDIKYVNKNGKWYQQVEGDINYFKGYTYEEFTDNLFNSTKNEINQLKQELERVETEGFGALKPIYNFYENTVTNILNKTYGKENVKVITDEYGNTWNEIEIKPEYLENIKFQTPKLEYTGDLAIEEKIAEMAENSKDEKIAKTKLEKFIQNIKNFFRDLFKERDGISRLIRDLNQGRFANLQKTNVSKQAENNTFYQSVETEEHKIIEELKKADQDKIVENVQDFSDAIKSRLSSILKNKNYERLKTILTSENGLNKWEALNTLLNDAAKSKTDFEDVEKNVNSLLRKARAIATGIVQMDNMTDLIFEDVKTIVANKENALDNITTLQYHLYALKDFKIFLEEAEITFEGSKITTSKISDVLGKIKAIERYIIQNDTAGIVQAFKPYVSENIDNFLKYFREERDRLKKLELNSKSKENKLAYKKQADSLDKFITQWDLTQDKNIVEFLQGVRGDANLANMLLEAYSDSTDPIISSFTSWLKDNLQDVKVEALKFEKEYEKELATPYKQLSRFNPEEVGKQITNESDRVDWEGNEYKVVELLNPFSGKENFRGEQRSYQFIEQTYRNETKQLQELIKNGEDVEENKDKLHKLNKEFALWRREFMQQEYNDKYYEKYDLWNDPIGQELKEDVEEIFTQIRDLQNTAFLSNNELDPITEAAIDALYKQYILLGNVNNLDGTPKTGKELEKAQKMQQIRALNRELYEYLPNEVAYEKAKTKHSEYILSTGITEDSPEYKEEMQKWEDENTRMEISPEFYEVRSALYEELSSLTEDVPDFSEEITKKYGTFDSNWEIINNLEYGHRDEDNQVIGTEIQEKGTDRIRQAFKNLEMLQAVGRRASGLTKEEYAEYQYLFANKETLNREEITKLNTLSTKKKDKSVKAKRIQELFTEIKELQSRIPTEYYITTFNNLSQKYGVTLDYSGFFKATDILKSPEIVKLLKNEDFKEWFDKNHIEVEVWDNHLKQVVKEYKRLPHWNRIIPNNSDYIKTVPARKYSTRQVKPEYRTGYNASTGNVELKVGVHIDNKGDFLPKPGKFKSAEYEALKNANNPTQKALFDVLQIHTKYTLKAQENTANRNKLGLDIPRLRKSSTESNMELLKKMQEKPSEIPSLLWNRIVSKWKNSTDYSQGEGVFQHVFADKYGNEHVSVPIKYTGKLDASDVSLDLFKAISKYSNSIKLNKKLVEISPVQQALQRILGSPSHQPLDLAKKVVGTDKSPKSKTNTRQLAVQNIVRRVFEGQEKQMELGEFGEKVSSITKSLTVLKSIAFDIPASIANVINAESQNFVNASNGYISLSDLGEAHSIFFKEYLPAFLTDYKNNHIGKESLQSQVFDMFNFIASETYESKVGEKLSQSKLKDILALNWVRNHRQWGEVFVQTVNALAYLNATKVEQTLPDGSKITIPLRQAYELDGNGEIKLKDGIDEQWSPNGFKTKRLIIKIEYHNRRVHGNYAKGIDKPEAETYTTFSLFIMMKRFFTSMALNRFAASKVQKTPKGIRFIPRYNQIGGAEIGYYLEALNYASKEIESKLITGEFDSMTDSEKIALLKTGKDVATMALAYFLLYVVFGWDDDDEDKYKKLRENSWMFNQGLYQSARLLTESTTFINPIQYKDFILSEPFVSKTLADWYDLIRYTLSQEEYEKDYGLYEKGETKAKAKLYKVTGVEKVLKTTGDENQQVVDYMKLRAR